MKKRMNKKAQQSNWFMIVLVLAVMVLVVVGLAVTGAFGKIIDFFSKVSDIEVAAQACQVYAGQNLKTSYCGFQKVKINSQVQYADCPNLKILGAFFDSKDMGCTDVKNTPKNYCENQRLKCNAIVNQKTCTELGANGCVGDNPDNNAKPAK